MVDSDDIRFVLIDILQTDNSLLPGERCLPEEHTNHLRTPMHRLASLVERIAHRQHNPRDQKPKGQLNKDVNCKNKT